MSKDAAAGIAPSEDAFKRHGLATGALGILIDRNLQDQNAQLNLIFCNFETYAKDKCASPASRNFIKSATLGANGEALTFITNKDATVTLAQPYTKFGRRHYGDLTIKMDGVKSQWTRTVGGVESFTTTATNGVRSWTENPDCSEGAFSRNSLAQSISMR